MKRQELIERLYQSHNSFIDYLQRLSDHDFVFSYNRKWSAGQQLDHIIKCLNTTIRIFTLPKFIIRLVFGKANRKTKSYDLFITRYEERIAEGTNPAKKFLPGEINIEKREELINNLTVSLNKLCNRVSGFSEEQLDNLIMPHPMFGKITIREMVYFTIHHVKHHEEITRRNLRREENVV